MKTKAVALLLSAVMAIPVAGFAAESSSNTAGAGGTAASGAAVGGVSAGTIAAVVAAVAVAVAIASSNDSSNPVATSGTTGTR